MPSDDALILRFEQFELDPGRFELRRAGDVIAIEPQVFALILLLASNPGQLVTRDEIVEKVWLGRIVSEAAISSRIKSARAALNDDGRQQRLIRTVHGKGLRFEGAVSFHRPQNAAAIGQPDQPDALRHGAGRPSIAVLPFRIAGDAGSHAYLGDAIADELIGDLSRLRWLFVIARGSAFRFRGPHTDCREAGAALGVAYCLTGGITFVAGAVTVTTELADTSSGEVVWSETWREAVERAPELRAEIAAHVATALEVRIAAHEARLARSIPPASLSAWSAYHLGLDHMFRFNPADNALAAGLFARAMAADPDFARAQAGLSFTHFQNGFLNYRPDRAAEVEMAHRLAEQALGLDRLDSFCHLNMGRSLWLSGDLAESLEWLEQAIALSPSYAQAVYSRAWTKTLLGEAGAGEEDARLALQLSPLDPLRYAMLATMALSRVVRGDYAEAARLAERAARSPGAHKHIALIAAVATGLAGETDNAAQWLARASRSDPGLSAGDFLASFPFAPTAARETIERTLADMGLKRG